MGFNFHDLGDLVRVSAVFTDTESEAAVDPDVVNLSVRSPDGEVVTYLYGTDAEVEKDSTGNYHTDIDVDQAGIWFYRWWSTGDGQAATENRFSVRAAFAV